MRAADPNLAGAFDAIAEHYDRRYEHNAVLDYMREAALAEVNRLAQPREWWLEVGCGTGRDAFHLATRGVHVVATDVSPGMIRQLTTRMAVERTPGWLLPQIVGTAGLGRLALHWNGVRDERRDGRAKASEPVRAVRSIGDLRSHQTSGRASWG